MNNLHFGRDYFIPKPVDPRLISEVSAAVAKAAIDSGVARKQIENWDEYKDSLSVLLGQETKLTQKLYATAAAHPQRVVFAEAVHPTMLKAAVQAKAEGICHPILLGNDEVIMKLATSLDLSLEGQKSGNRRIFLWRSPYPPRPSAGPPGDMRPSLHCGRCLSVVASLLPSARA